MIPESVIVLESNESALASALADFFSKNQYTSVAVIVDENTDEHCLPFIKDHIPEHWVIKIRAGEEYKTIDTCNAIWQALTDAKFDRKGLVINLGGGVIGDMGGFAAASYKRGIDFINIPTTLLSQVDASVGGKLGVDFNGFKNHVGFFKDPKRVLINPIFYKTLSKRELRSGYAEVIKHALIADREHWKALVDLEFLKINWSEIVGHSVGIKGDVVTNDPFESGRRKILNFGHTVGHAVETKLLENPTEKLLHGEAIAVGMICEAHLSYKLSGLPEDEMEEICQFLTNAYDCKKIPQGYFEEIIQNTYQDKKNTGNTINASLLGAIGDCKINIPIGEGDILDSLYFYNKILNK